MTSQERIQEINELKARHLLEVACVPLDALTFPFSGNLNNGNIERLRKAFGGNRCFNEKEEYQIPAIISRDDFDKGIITKREGKRSWFDPAPGVKLQCLRGLHRVRAAEMLYHPPERWLVAIYDSDHIGYKASRDLEEEYDLAEIPSDGHFYYRIRHYEGRHGNGSDFTLAGWWYARLNGHPRDRNAGRTMKRLNTHPLYDSALNCLHRIEALYSAYNVDYKLGFTFGSIPRLLTLGCREELVDTSLQQLKDFWYRVFDGDESIMGEMDASSITILEGKAPGAVEEHQAALSGLVERGKVFTRLDKKSRKKCFKRLCRATRRAQVPSFGIFFKNLTYFETLKNCLNRLIVDPQDETVYSGKAKGGRANRDRDETTRSAFKRAFFFQDHQRLIQVDDSNMVRVRIDDEKTAFDVAYRQLWLFAIRRQADMPTRHQPKKVGPRGDPVNRAVLYEFALLAKALGFMTPTIRKLLDPTQHPDRAAVRQMLENARKGYSYPDMERSISACLAQLNTAVPGTKKVETDDSEYTDKVDLWGRPLDAHATMDRPRLYLHVLHRPWDGRKERSISSYFVARSQYFSWLGEELGTELNINDDDPRIPLCGENVTRLENDTMTLGTDGGPDNVQQRDSRDIALEEEELRLQEQLKAQKEVLEEEVSRLRSEKDQLQHDKSKLKSRMKDLHAKAKAAVDRNEKLDEAENGLREMAKCLNEEIADLIRKRDGLIQLLHDLEQRYREQGSIPVQDFRAVDLEQQDQPEMVDAGLPIFEVGLTSDDDDELGPAGAMASLDTDMDASYTGYGSSQESQAERDEGGHDTDMNESCTGHGTGTENNTIHFVKFDLVTKELQPKEEAKTKEDTQRIAADLQAENNRLYVYRSAGPLEIAGEVGEANCYKAAIKRRDRTILVVPDAQGVPEPRRKVGRQGQRDGSSRKARLDRSEVYKKRPVAGTSDGYRRRYQKRREGPNGPLRTTDKRERRGERRRHENPQPLRPEPLRPEPLRPEPLRPEPLRPEPLRPEPPRPEPPRPEPPRPEPPRPEPLRPEPLRPEPLRPEPLRPETPPLQPPPPEPNQSTTESDEQKRQDPGGHESQSSDDNLRVRIIHGHLRLREDKQLAERAAAVTSTNDREDKPKPRRPARPRPAEPEDQTRLTKRKPDNEQQEARDDHTKPLPSRGFLRQGIREKDSHRDKRRRLEHGSQEDEEFGSADHVESEGAESPAGPPGQHQSIDKRSIPRIV